MADQSDIRKRAIILGVILVVINAYWVGIASELWYSVFTLVNPFSNAIFTLIILMALSYGFSKFSKRLSLTPAELLIIYIMVTMVSTISGHAMMAIMFGALAQPYWFATPENEWQQLFWPHIPSWFTMSDTDLLTGYFEGESTIHSMEKLKAWAIPALVWSSFIFVLYFSMLLIGNILRRQWMENERLTYPITQLPVNMTLDRKFFKSRLMWIGLGISASIRLINTFHDLVPSIPQIPYSYNMGQYLTDKPWNAIGYVSMSFNLAIVGLTYFMPLDLAFSCWFFFWLTRLERIIASIAGWNQLYLNERASGAWVGICLIALWASRRHLIAFTRHILGQQQMDDSREPMRYRAAAILLILCFISLLIFSYMAGMDIWVIIVFFALFYAFAIAIGRVRAELGPPYHEVIGINPRQMMVQMFGAKTLRANNLIVMTFYYAFNRCNRSHAMPCELEALKIGDRAGMDGKKLIWAITLALSIGAIATFWSYLQVAYKYGTLAKCRGHVGHFGRECFNPVQGWLQYPRGIDGRAVGFMGGGLGFVFLLYFMRTRFLWWPLHASGYVLSGASWGGMIYFWFPVMVSWLIKSIILRHGGRGTHRKAIPFFLGLVLGDFIPRSIASIISLLFNLYMPSSGAGHTL